MKMKNLLMAAATLTTLGVVGNTTAKASATTSNPMYRVYNPNSGEHFYTKSAYEKSVLVNSGWRYEGKAWDAPTTGANVYRVYNPNSGEHFYTKSAYEKSVLVNSGWRYEGVEWHTANSGVPLYRVYNPNSGEHFYTKDSYEKSVLVKAGWRYEGIAWYGVAPTPVHHVFQAWVKNKAGVVIWKQNCSTWNEATQAAANYGNSQLAAGNYDIGNYGVTQIS